MTSQNNSLLSGFNEKLLVQGRLKSGRLGGILKDHLLIGNVMDVPYLEEGRLLHVPRPSNSHRGRR